MAVRFVNLDAKTWMIGPKADRARRNALTTPASFEDIVERLRSRATVEAVVRNGLQADRSFKRVVAVVRADATAIGLFHSAASGYRAQYYAGVSVGEGANAYAVAALSPIVMRFIQEHPNKRFGTNWARASLSGPGCKIWIHQGLWIRWRRLSDRMIYPCRWAEKSEPLSDQEKKLLLFGSLAPFDETRLRIMGAFVNCTGAYGPDNIKPCRSQELYDYGFT